MKNNSFADTIDTVGPAVEETLQENGYKTYADLAAENPFVLMNNCNVVFASATQIISDALEEMNGYCPECNSPNHTPVWQKTEMEKDQHDIPDSHDLFCNDCHWTGKAEKINTKQQEQTPHLF